MYDLDERDELVRPGWLPMKTVGDLHNIHCFVASDTNMSSYLDLISRGDDDHDGFLERHPHAYLNTSSFHIESLGRYRMLSRQLPPRSLTPSHRHGSAALEDRRTRPGLPWCFSAETGTGTEPYRQMPRISVPLTSHLALLQDLTARCRKSYTSIRGLFLFSWRIGRRGSGGSIRVKQGFAVDRARELINLILLLSAMPDVLHMGSV